MAGSACADGFLTGPKPLRAIVRCDVRQAAEAVNRRLLGMCAMYPPFDEAYAGLMRPSLRGASVRLWANSFEESYWQQFMPFVKGVAPAEIYGCRLLVRHDEQVRYGGPRDHNLEDYQTPEHLAMLVGFLNKQAHPGFPDGYRIRYWEIWNEPEFSVNGAWPAEDYARYVLDCSRAVRAIDPSVRIGACLTSSREWNEKVLGAIAREDVAAIDFVIEHHYDTAWFFALDTMGSYYGRLGFAEVMRPHVRRTQELLRRFSGGRWYLAVTEWNTHPQTYGPPTQVSRDLTVALHAAAMLQMYWEEGVRAAQYFLLRTDPTDRGDGAAENAHFSLTAQHADGSIVRRPTFYVFDWYGRYFRGRRVPVTTLGPTYLYTNPAWPGWKIHENVPMLAAAAAYDEKSGALCLMLVNRHADEPLAVRLEIAGMTPAAQALRSTLTGEAPEAETPIVTEDVPESLSFDSGATVIEVPPHSFVALRVRNQGSSKQDE